MNRSKKTALLIVAAILIVAGLALIAYSVIYLMGNEGDAGSDAPKHAETEYTYDDEGNITSEKYYKNDVFTGQTDFYTSNDSKTQYAIRYDADLKEIGSTVTKMNSFGTILSVQVKEMGEIVSLTEYSYQDDMVTPKKKVEKTYEDGVEFAVKTYYSENGTKTRVCEFEDGEMTADTYYDEKGNVIENGGETIEE